MTRRGAFSGRGTLTILALMLASSGALRFGTGVGQAVASVSETTASAPGPLVCPDPPLAVVEALRTREDEVRRREERLAERLAALDLAEAAASRRLAELREARDALAQTIAQADGAAEGDLARLTAVYEAMKPAEAARLFGAMDPDFASGFLGRMRPEAAAAVLAGLDPETAYAISARLAGRNALAPRD